MRRDNLIGIILGIVILVIIGVFLSTRTSDIEMVIPDLVLSEEGSQESEIEEIDISEIAKESKKSEPEKASSVEYSSDEALVKEELVESTQLEEQPVKTLVEKPKDETSLEGKWEGVAEEIVEEPEITEDAEIAHKFPSAEETVIPGTNQQTSSYGASTDTIYKVQSNDSLTKISRKYYGDDEKWTLIFEANKDSMSNPNALYVGQKLLIPGITIGKETDKVIQTPVKKKSKKERNVDVHTHTVEAGDTLYRLAIKYYDDPTVWIKIYEANEDTIEDKGLLIKGQILIIPKL